MEGLVVGKERRWKKIHEKVRKGQGKIIYMRKRREVEEGEKRKE